jgi:hypothetical protein
MLLKLKGLGGTELEIDATTTSQTAVLAVRRLAVKLFRLDVRNAGLAGYMRQTWCDRGSDRDTRAFYANRVGVVCYQGLWVG